MRTIFVDQYNNPLALYPWSLVPVKTFVTIDPATNEPVLVMKYTGEVFEGIPHTVQEALKNGATV